MEKGKDKKSIDSKQICIKQENLRSVIEKDEVYPTKENITTL